MGIQEGGHSPNIWAEQYLQAEFFDKLCAQFVPFAQLHINALPVQLSAPLCNTNICRVADSTGFFSYG
jgi:hypothetical protein